MSRRDSSRHRKSKATIATGRESTGGESTRYHYEALACWSCKSRAQGEKHIFTFVDFTCFRHPMNRLLLQALSCICFAAPLGVLLLLEGPQILNSCLDLKAWRRKSNLIGHRSTR